MITISLQTVYYVLGIASICVQQHIRLDMRLVRTQENNRPGLVN